MSNNFKNPFDRNGITSLLFLEDTNLKHYKEKTIVKQLVEIYVKLIEYYDMVKDPIKTYFMDKMQRIIINYNKSKSKINAETYIKKNLNPKRVSSLLKLNTKSSKNNTKLYELRRLKIQKEIQMNNEIDKKTELRKSYLEEIQKFEKNNELNTSIIKINLEKQKKGINDKLKKRRDRSMSRNIQKSFMNSSGVGMKNSFRKKRGTSMLPPPRKGKKVVKAFGEHLKEFEKDVSGICINQNLLSKINP